MLREVCGTVIRCISHRPNNSPRSPPEPVCDCAVPHINPRDPCSLRIVLENFSRIIALHLRQTFQKFLGVGRGRPRKGDAPIFKRYHSIYRPCCFRPTRVAVILSAYPAESGARSASCNFPIIVAVGARGPGLISITRPIRGRLYAALDRT